GLNLAWNDCGLAGSQLATFGCATNTGAQSLVASLVAASDVSSARVLEGEVEISSAPGTTLPLWWQLQGAGCRAPGGSASVSFTTESCLNPWTGGANVDPTSVAYPADDAKRVEKIKTSIILPSGFAMDPSTEYEMFKFVVNHNRTVGAGACAGCATPVR